MVGKMNSDTANKLTGFYKENKGRATCRRICDVANKRLGCA